MQKKMAWCLVGAGAVIVCVAADAVACGGAMLESYDRGALLVAEKVRVRDADEKLRGGDYEAAAWLAGRVGNVSEHGFVRARRVLARVIARTDGKYTITGSDGGLPAENLANATLMLEAMADQTNDPRALTDLGELLSRQPEHFARALALLEDLARRDLITSAEGWAALASLRSPGGREEALKRCVLMTAEPERVCGVATPGSDEQTTKPAT